MGYWSERVFPRILDRALDTPRMAALRREALAEASGRVLEIGFGTGLNLACLPDSVTELDAIDPNPGMRALADPRIVRSGLTVRFAQHGGEALPFEDGSFDTVVTTFTLCTIDEVDVALSEIRRVLRPGGAFLFMEHGLAPDPLVAGVQHLLNPVEWWFAGGCRLTRQPVALIETAGFVVERQRSLYGPGMITHAWFTLGRARR